jgi:hypothetical protein
LATAATRSCTLELGETLNGRAVALAAISGLLDYCGALGPDTRRLLNQAAFVAAADLLKARDEAARAGMLRAGLV